MLLSCFSHLFKIHSGLLFDFNEFSYHTGEPSFQLTIYISDTRLYYSKASRSQEKSNEALQCPDEIQSIRSDSSEKSAEIILQCVEDDMKLVLFVSEKEWAWTCFLAGLAAGTLFSRETLLTKKERRDYGIILGEIL